MLTVLGLLSEFFGTFAFILSYLITGGHVLVVGLTFTLVKFLIQKISGGNLNPLVSLVLFFDSKLDFSTSMAFILMQFLGAIGAFYSYKLVTL